eukprot:scaffold34685_cov183-Amphora_coffeaeformis.AAC.43
MQDSSSESMNATIPAVVWYGTIQLLYPTTTLWYEVLGTCYESETSRRNEESNERDPWSDMFRVETKERGSLKCCCRGRAHWQGTFPLLQHNRLSHVLSKHYTSYWEVEMRTELAIFIPC